MGENEEGDLMIAWVGRGHGIITRKLYRYDVNFISFGLVKQTWKRCALMFNGGGKL